MTGNGQYKSIFISKGSGLFNKKHLDVLQSLANATKKATSDITLDCWVDHSVVTKQFKLLHFKLREAIKLMVMKKKKPLLKLEISRKGHFFWSQCKKNNTNHTKYEKLGKD